MTHRAGVAFVCAAALVVSCSRVKVDKAEFGGDLENQLAAATAAHDSGAVDRLLAAGANPNRMVKHDGLYHSPWELALAQVRPKHPELVAIVKSMIKSGANLEAAWGESNSRGITRRGPSNPIAVAMLHPVPDVIRALMDAGLDRRLGQTPLVMAIEGGEIEIAHILVDAGVNVNCNPGANTPLVAAIEARDEALMTYLEAHGAREKP